MNGGRQHRVRLLLMRRAGGPLAACCVLSSLVRTVRYTVVCAVRCLALSIGQKTKSTQAWTAIGHSTVEAADS